MGSINKYTIPQAFFTSAQSTMFLKTPEPQYLFAQMALAGRLQSLAIQDGAQNVLEWVRAATGQQEPELARLVRVNEMFPDAIINVTELGKAAGDTVKLQRPVYSGGGYTENDRKVTVDSATSTTGMTISGEDVVVSLFEFEGPFASGGSVVQPYILREFDTLYRASNTNLVSKVTRHLNRDYIKWMDTVIRDKFRLSSNVTLPSGIANAAAFVAGGGQQISLLQIAAAKEALVSRDWESFGGRFVAFCPPSFQKQMVEDPDWRQLSKAHQADKNVLFSPIGSYQNIDFYECTTMKSYTNPDTIGGSTVASGVTLNEIIVFGPGAVGMGSGRSVELRAADDTNYGKEVKLIWNAIHGFEMLDARGVQRIIYQTV